MARDATAFRLVQAGALVGCLMLPGPAWAQGAAQQDDPETAACHGRASTLDIVDCLGRLSARWDARLNAAYQAAVRAAGGGAEPSLRAAERAWLEYRRQRCAYVSAVPGTIAQVIGADCMLRMTKARAEELAADLRGLGEPG
jgi:uncharacterized protein YecT (DUF1311 family)